MPDYQGGYTQGAEALSALQSRGILDAMRSSEIAKSLQAYQAQQQWGPILARLAQAGSQAGGIPPIPGTQAGGPQPPPPGTSSQPAPRPMPMQPGGDIPSAPMAVGTPAPAMIPPFKPMPNAPASAAAPPPTAGASPEGAIPPPPAPASQPMPAGAAGGDPGQFALPNILRSLKEANVPPEQWGTMLDNLPAPVKENAAQQIKMLHEQNQSLINWANATSRERTADAAESRARTAQVEADRRREQGDARLQLQREKQEFLQRRLTATSGGTGALKNVEYIYPKKADGSGIDQSAPPIGVRGTTKSGKIVYLNTDGVSTTAAELTGGTAKEDKATKGSGKDTVRANIVKSGVKNSLDRLEEIKKDAKGITTSSFFGQHAENPVTRKLYGEGKRQLGGKQQQVDAKWASFIDEAIPVFTGGLRGSDAFRRFLIEQAPGPGEEASWDEKVRLLEANINGTSKAFFNKFSSDPTMWAPGTKPEDVEAAKGGAATTPAASPAAPQQPTRITGDADYAKLPSGAEFIGPDGVKRKKP